MNEKQYLKKVYVAQNLQDAYLVKSLLEENGIESFVKHEITGMLYGVMFAEVWVDSENADQAKRIIHEEYNEEPTDDIS